MVPAPKTGYCAEGEVDAKACEDDLQKIKVRGAGWSMLRAVQEVMSFGIDRPSDCWQVLEARSSERKRGLTRVGATCVANGCRIGARRFHREPSESSETVMREAF